jgi:hypothetical protein
MRAISHTCLHLHLPGQEWSGAPRCQFLSSEFKIVRICLLREEVGSLLFLLWHYR